MKKLVRQDKFFVYIVECRNGTFYTGHTNDLQKRLREHNESKRGARYTRCKRPVKLVWKKEYRHSKYAMSAEHKIKELNRYQKKLLVGGMRLDKVLARKL